MTIDRVHSEDAMYAKSQSDCKNCDELTMREKIDANNTVMYLDLQWKLRS